MSGQRRGLPGQYWGATAAEIGMELPCDGVLSGRTVVCDRVVDVSAPQELVFAWVCQLRAAPYSYDLLDNFGRRSPVIRDPHLTELVAGQRFMTLFELTGYTPGTQVTLRASGVAVTYAVHPGTTAGTSRLHARVYFRGRSWLLAPIIFGDYLMMRKQLLTLKNLAHREAHAA
ncbi:MAG: hypothetical protein JWN03_1517 [Nocardia sp.]|uniref:hypothetical protein n=1 Tax=Nocardia sp. TaxID=1821 RepID=UPI00262302B1|nr:hypothetical protein [Nocardia sp.]MCU1641242.1 hypothetical protein [Nocardia sp.]